MKKILLSFACVAMILFQFPTTSQALFYRGNDLVEYMERYERLKNNNEYNDTDYAGAMLFTGYVVGVYDAQRISFMPDVEGIRTTAQITAIVAKYLKAHPERWSEPASSLVLRALMEAFPYPEK